jgi:multiple sugar transport system permease protein
MLCAPAVIVMLAVTAYPIGYAIYLSLLRADLRFPNAQTWVGLNNYIAVLGSGLWWTDVWHTVLITVVSVGIELVLGMLLALVMHRAIFGRGLVRTSALIPYGIVTVVAAFAWRFAWAKAEGGFVPGLLGLSYDPLDPTHPFTNFLVVILTEVWKTTPFMALLLLAGLTLVPEELHEAAKVDGASTWQRFWRITIPLMKPAILVALLFRTLDAFRIFDSVYIISNGSNPKLETVSVLGYNQLLNRLNLGLGSAVSVLVFLCVALIAFFFVKILGTSVQRES